MAMTVDPFPELGTASKSRKTTNNGTKKSWAELHQHVKAARHLQASLTNKVGYVMLNQIHIKN